MALKWGSGPVREVGPPVSHEMHEAFIEQNAQGRARMHRKALENKEMRKKEEACREQEELAATEKAAADVVLTREQKVLAELRREEEERILRKHKRGAPPVSGDALSGERNPDASQARPLQATTAEAGSAGAASTTGATSAVEGGASPALCMSDLAAGSGSAALPLPSPDAGRPRGGGAKPLALSEADALSKLYGVRAYGHPHPTAIEKRVLEGRVRARERCARGVRSEMVLAGSLRHCQDLLGTVSAANKSAAIAIAVPIRTEPHITYFNTVDQTCDYKFDSSLSLDARGATAYVPAWRRAMHEAEEQALMQRKVDSAQLTERLYPKPKEGQTRPMHMSARDWRKQHMADAKAKKDRELLGESDGVEGQTQEPAAVSARACAVSERLYSAPAKRPCALATGVTSDMTPQRNADAARSAEAAAHAAKLSARSPKGTETVHVTPRQEVEAKRAAMRAKRVAGRPNALAKPA